MQYKIGPLRLTTCNTGVINFHNRPGDPAQVTYRVRVTACGGFTLQQECCCNPRLRLSAPSLAWEKYYATLMIRHLTLYYIVASPRAERPADINISTKYFSV